MLSVKASGRIDQSLILNPNFFATTVEIKGHPLSPANKTYPCTAPYAIIGEPELLSCTIDFYQFSFNSNNGRFVFGKLAGYVGGDGDSITVTLGKCDKF